ncbi:MAG: penicillin-binding protein 1A [Halieaceae bacterium]|jgi:penicillin-binding protein 1A
MAQTNTTIKHALWLIPIAFFGAIWLSTSVYLYLSPKLPSVEVLRNVKLQTPLRVYTADGELIGQFGEQKRNPLMFKQIPEPFVRALLAAEDDGFFQHSGIDVLGLVRAVTELVATGEKGSGGSTLTMQVARNFFLSRERTYTRKFNEILLALEIERKLSKEEIFELYVNQVFLGHRAYGFEAASQVYYGKHIGELTLAQLAMIAGLPKAPSTYNPLSNPSRAKVRRDWILGRMLTLNYIQQDEHDAALTSPVTASHHGAKLSFDAPYVAEMVRKEMISRYGLPAYNDGYRVYTTVDSTLQKAARDAVLKSLSAYDDRHGYRGPEGRYPPTPDAEPLEAWLQVLAATPDVAQWTPAIVTALRDDAFDAVVGNGQIHTLSWGKNKGFARPFITIDARGRTPGLPLDALAIGDLIRLKTGVDEPPRLSQLPKAQAALVSLRPDDGAILSLVGGYGFKQSKFNRVTQAKRLPGSNFKPFIYTAALNSGFTAATVINDAPIVINDSTLESTWRPENDGGKFYGPTRLRWALTQSRNLVSIRLLRALGVRNAIDYVDRFGFDRQLLPADLSLALGTYAVTPMALAAAYASIANGGYKVAPYLIDRIDDIRGNTIHQATPDTVCRLCEAEALAAKELSPAQMVASERGSAELSMEAILSAEPVGASKLPIAKRIIEERTAYIIDSILKDVITKGTGKQALILKRGDIAGKTGTTNGPTDAWFSGYNPNVVTSAWVGHDNNGLLGRREYGGSAALPIWIDYMAVALADSPEVYRPTPAGLVNVRIDPNTGALARPGQATAIFEIFREEYVPKQSTSTSTAGPRGSDPVDIFQDLF